MDADVHNNMFYFVFSIHLRTVKINNNNKNVLL